MGGRLKGALPLNSARWRTLRAHVGDASEVPALIRACRKKPCRETYDRLHDKLVGDGCLGPRDSIFAALPYLVELLDHLDGADKEWVIAMLGWITAIVMRPLDPTPDEEGEPPDPADFKCPDDLRGRHLDDAVERIADHALKMIRSGVSRSNRQWVLAAFATGSGKFQQALDIIRDI